MVLIPSTISMNVPVELNFLYELRIHLSSLWVGYIEKTRLCAKLVMRYSDYGIWVMSYSKIGVTSAYEFFM